MFSEIKSDYSKYKYILEYNIYYTILSAYWSSYATRKIKNNICVCHSQKFTHKIMHVEVRTIINGVKHHTFRKHYGLYFKLPKEVKSFYNFFLFNLLRICNCGEIVAKR